MKMNSRVVVLLVLGVIAFALGVSASIENSKHDFSSASWNTGGEICQPCHTPHNAQTNQLVPLWNHTNTTTASFQVYTSATLDATVGQPNNESLACLSCHDGSVALNAFGGGSGAAVTIGVSSPTKNVGTDLRNDHPISFDYSTAGAGLHPATNAGVAPLLFSGKVQCSSCHDVHNEGTGTTNLLVKSNAGSDLCLTCHDK